MIPGDSQRLSQTGPGLTGAKAEALRALERVTVGLSCLSAEHLRWLHALVSAGHRSEALQVLQTAASLPSGRLEDLEALAFQAFGLGEHTVARDLYARFVSSRPADATAWYNLAAAERTLGRFEQSEEACDRALRIDPGLVAAALLRAQVRRQSPDANHVSELARWIAQAKDPRASVVLHYAIGKELEDLGEYDEAFRCFARGALLRRQSLDYDVNRDLWKLAKIQETFDESRIRQAAPLRSATYGFIVGLPRSGTTMIERVLTNSADVASNGETDNLIMALGEGAPSNETDVFKRIACADPLAVEPAYARRAQDPRRCPIVLEKLPFNYLYAGAIRLTLPSARVIAVNRALADCGLAMYTTLFGSAYPFSYDLGELAQYFIAYRRLISHWQKVAADQMITTSYEAFVSDPLAQGRRVAEHLGVAWSDAMVRIEDNPTGSATASAVQVRQPIHTGASGRWRRYRAQLSVLWDALEAAGIDPAHF